MVEKTKSIEDYDKELKKYKLRSVSCDFSDFGIMATEVTK